MNTVKYDFASNVLRLNFPAQWDPALVSAATVTVTDTAGTELQAADAATLPGSTTTRTAVSRFATTINIHASYAGDISIGDQLKLVGNGGSEVVIVKGYEPIDRIVEIYGTTDNEYERLAGVYPMYATYTLDTTNTTNYPNGSNIRVTWTPTGAGNATDQMFEVLQTALEIEGFEASFRALYPRAYDVLSKTPGRFEEVRDAAEMRLYVDLSSDNLDLYQIKDQRVIKPVMMALTAYMYTLNGDKDIEDERNALRVDYDDRLASLKRLPIWVDTNLDGIQDEEEITTHQTTFERGW
jgi:hypothetical protein